MPDACLPGGAITFIHIDLHLPRTALRVLSYRKLVRTSKIVWITVRSLKRPDDFYWRAVKDFMVPSTPRVLERGGVRATPKDMHWALTSQEPLDARPFDIGPSLVVPPEEIPFPPIVIVMTRSARSTHVREYQELSIVFHDPCIPGTAFGCATYTS